ncbi:KR domain-containing protein [Ophiobolus disseminans]|uniref:KR domain-containing protein n=1 Tax=Ophiobolus disseminans TaxID=1469910 RepID=A0A6A6ZK85_9PLEO|nr:KR domain-containing protein [Ophiobolus disseminans]
MSASNCFGLRRTKESTPRPAEWTDSTTALDDSNTHTSTVSKAHVRSKSSHAEVNGRQRIKSFGFRSVRKTPSDVPIIEKGDAWQQQPLPTPPASTTRSGSDPLGQNYQTPIAVCGLALRLPGGIRDGDAFWDVLLNGKDMRSKIPSTRYNPTGFMSGASPPYGYFLDEDLAALDTSFFNLRKSELESADPQQRQLLEVTRECLENAGETNYRGKAIGCYVGTFGEDWQQMMTKDEEHMEAHAAGCMPDLMLANRISYEFDFQGPSIVLKTGCSASLVGVHEACRALQSGDCEAAIVAGANIIMTPTATQSLSLQGVLSPEGSSKTFDASADGYGRGEAINAIFIKRLDDAVRDKNPVRAIIRGTGTNSDGRGIGPLTPNGKAHESLMRNTYWNSGLDPRDTAFVECHGTGTATGDPIETTAIGNVFGERGVLIGAVKPNVGHSEGASGITSLIKAILALENRIIPPNIKFNTPHPKIPFVEKRLIVPVVPTSFPTDRAERISVCSYGIGGSNAHVIVESSHHLKDHLTQSVAPKQLDTPRLLLFSANNQASTQEVVTQHAAYLDANPGKLADLSYTLAKHRERLPYRSFSVCRPGTKLNASPAVKAPASSPSICMVFSGQGAQWPQMGLELCNGDESFRRDIVFMDHVLHDLKCAPSWTIMSELRRSSDQSRVHCAEFSQPLCTAIQLALVNFYARCGIFPTAVVGHSSGEIAAAYAAGNLTMREAIIISYYRGLITMKNKQKGCMAAVGLSASTASAYLLDGVVVACENSPSSVTLSGDIDSLRQVMASIKTQHPDVLVRELKVDMAYHSSHMMPLASDYLHYIRSELGSSFAGDKFCATMFSTVLGKELHSSTTLPLEYWCANLVRPVLFNTTATALVKAFPSAILLEIGPHSTLAGPLRAIAMEAAASTQYVSTLSRSSPSYENILSALGTLYQHGIDVDFTGAVPSGNALSNLPAYPWTRTTHWSESRLSKDWRFRQHARHPLLGQRALESSSIEPTWRSVLTLEKEPWLRDHKVRDDIVFPLAGFVTMAGAAAQQQSGNNEAFRLRHVVAHTALVLLEAKSVELSTTLKPHRLTDVTNSVWHDFTISSWNGSSWTEHCHGQVRAVVADQKCTDDWTVPSRAITSTKWYKFTKQIGLGYGPEFQGIKDIRSATGTPHVLSNIVSPQSQMTALFLTHPCTLDCSFQLMLLAFTKGDFSSRTLYVPTMIESLYISQSSASVEAKAWVHDGKMQNGVECIKDGKTIVSLRGLKFAPLPNPEERSTPDRHAAAYLHWTPHIDFTRLDNLMVAQNAETHGNILWEEATLLCILDSVERLKGLQPHAPHFAKLRAWLQMQADRAITARYPLVPDCQLFTRLSTPERHHAIRARLEDLSSIPSKRLPVLGLKRLYENMPDVFTGAVDPLEILLHDNVLTEIYNMVSTDCGPVMRALANKKPNLRILEVGAGTGGTTAKIFSELFDEGSRQNPPFSLYTFTDVSAGFFDRAKERFSDVPNMDYRVFDISRSPLEQGFKAQSYDVIVAANCVHTTPSLKATLQNLQCLLQPDGHLVLSELSTDSNAPGYLFGVFSGWWMGDKDDRHDSPIVSLSRWDAELRSSGFNGILSSAFDYEEPYQYCATILAQPRKALGIAAERVTVLCKEQESAVAQCMLEGLKIAGYEATAATLGQDLSEVQQIISTLDLETSFFEDVQESLAAFQQVVRSKQIKKFLWLLPPCQINNSNPDSSKSLGMLRTTRAELGVPITTLEIKKDEANLPTIAIEVFEKSRPYSDTDKLMPDMEFAFDDGQVKVGRFHPFDLEEALVASNQSDHDNAEVELSIQQPGLLDSLKWVERPERTESLGDDEVEIIPGAIGLNFKDLALSLGLISSPTMHPRLGLELAGVIRRVGSSVTNVAVGDRVVALSSGGLFTSVAVLPSLLVAKIPDALGFEDAATMPICFGTTMRALMEIGHLEEGQIILIHSACGGVGQAAIQLAQLIGAEVYVTVGNAAKASYLTKTFGIPASHIFSSRDDSFREDLLHATGGQGADLVLNSLAGELLHASWECVAEFGIMIELGNRDLAEYGKLNMEPFLSNRSYACVDFGQVMDKRPKLVNGILNKVIAMYNDGKIRPLNPVTTFEASEIQNAFRFLQKGDHIGKAVIRMPHDVATVPREPIVFSLKFDSQSSYLITGGFGGLGSVVMQWMRQRGARNFVVMSPSAGSKLGHHNFIADMEFHGCSVTPVAGLVQNEKDVAKATAAAKSPIKGVIHLAMVLQNVSILGMQASDWENVMAPKCKGALNLHHAFQTQSEPLDFFLLAGSIAAHTESSGQGNYSAANTYLEAFCQYRHTFGLPASIISICPIEDAGFVAENRQAREAIDNQGFSYLTQREFLDCVELAVRSSTPHIGKSTERGMLGPQTWHNSSAFIMGLKSPKSLADPANHTSWRHDRRMGFYHNVNTDNTTQNRGEASQLGTFLVAVRANTTILDDKQAAETLALEIGKKVFTLILRDPEHVHVGMSMQDIGLDSLMAIELKRWWRQTFGREVSVLEMMGSGSLLELGHLAVGTLKKIHHVE